MGGGKRVLELGVALATLIAATPICIVIVLVWWVVLGELATIALLLLAAVAAHRFARSKPAPGSARRRPRLRLRRESPVSPATPEHGSPPPP